MMQRNFFLVFVFSVVLAVFAVGIHQSLGPRGGLWSDLHTGCLVHTLSSLNLPMLKRAYKS
jgi:hypothetical protein